MNRFLIPVFLGVLTLNGPATARGTFGDEREDSKDASVKLQHKEPTFHLVLRLRGGPQEESKDQLPETLTPLKRKDKETGSKKGAALKRPKMDYTQETPHTQTEKPSHTHPVAMKMSSEDDEETHDIFMDVERDLNEITGAIGTGLNAVASTVSNGLNGLWNCGNSCTHPEHEKNE